MKKLVLKIFAVLILSLGLSFAKPPSDGYNSIRVPGAIIFQTGGSLIDIVDIKDSGEIDFSIDKGQESTTSHRYVKYGNGIEGRYDLQTIDDGSLYRISQISGSTPQLLIYDVQKLLNTKKAGGDCKVCQISVDPDATYNILDGNGDRRYYGIQVMGNSKGEKIFVLFWINNPRIGGELKVYAGTYMLENGELVKKDEKITMVAAGEDYSGGTNVVEHGRKPVTRRHDGGEFKVRSIPGSNIIMGFSFMYNRLEFGTELSVQPYKINDDATITIPGGVYSS